MSFIGHTNPLITVRNYRRSGPRAAHSLTASRPRTRAGVRLPPGAPNPLVLRGNVHEASWNPSTPDVRSQNNLLGTIIPMPRTYKKSKKRTRRGRRRKYIPRAITTNTKLIKCKAVNYQNFTSAGTISMAPVQLNSMDDPFSTLGTGQPLGYDQWKALYKSAFVVGTKLTIKAHNNGTVAAMLGTTPMKIPQGTSALANYEYYMELPNTKSRILSQDVDHVTWHHKVGVKRFLSIKDLRDDDQSRIDLVNETAPTRLAYWHVWGQALDEAGTLDLDVVITVEYLVLLTDPIIPARSVET